MEKSVTVEMIMNSLPIKISRSQSDVFKSLKRLFGMSGKVTQKKKVYKENTSIEQKGVSLNESYYLKI